MPAAGPERSQRDSMLVVVAPAVRYGQNAAMVEGVHGD